MRFSGGSTQGANARSSQVTAQGGKPHIETAFRGAENEMHLGVARILYERLRFARRTQDLRDGRQGREPRVRLVELAVADERMELLSRAR